MDSFFALFYAMGVSTMFFDNWSDNFDVIGALPLEVAIMILRKLDGKSLLTAMKVSRRWHNIIRSDRVLRETVREELLRQKREKMMREMFLSRSVAHHFTAVTAPATSARAKAAPYARPVRKFEKSVKTVDGVGKAKSSRSWTSTVPSTKTTSLRQFR